MDSIKVRTIKYIVGKKLNLDLNRRSRKFEYVKARMMCYKILREQCNFSLQDIGRYFKKNHATVLHSLKEFDAVCIYDKKFKEDYESVEKMWCDPEREETGGISTVFKLDVNDALKKLNMECAYLSNAVERMMHNINELHKEIKEKYLELEKK